MNPILVRLNITPEQYESIVSDIYLAWCTEFAITSHNDLQKIVANRPVCNYFNTEFSKCEKEFLTIMQSYDGFSGIKPSVAMKLFYGVSEIIFKRYPKVLINNAKKPITISNDTTAN
ncbi:MAG: hypothetical protein E2604_01545 [Flavobacterium sp.]|nr:hypothetical protein [Flavobacterium sp.]